MPSTGLVARGMSLAVSDGASPEVYTVIPNVDNISGPSSSTGEIEITDLASTAKEFLLDLVDHGQVSFTGYHNPTETLHAQLQTDLVASTERNYRITFASSPEVTWTFQARVSEFTQEGSVGTAKRFNAALRVSDSVTVA